MNDRLRVRLKQRARTLCLCALAVLLAGPAVAARGDDAGSLNEYQIKAGFLFNFLRFVEWPGKAFASPSSPIVVCVVGESPVTALLTETVAGKVVGGRSIQVKRSKATDDLHGCNMVFVTSTEERRAKRLVEDLKNASVLTVGEMNGFPQAGGVLNFFTQENKVKLEINLDAANHANLKISAKLIAVSRLVNEKSSAGGR